MAGTFTPGNVDPSTVLGNCRVLMGVLEAANGSGAAIATGLSKIYWMGVTPKSAATTGASSKWTYSGGSATPVTCTSGDTFDAFIVGV